MPRAVDALLVVIQDLCLRQDYLVAAFPATQGLLPIPGMAAPTELRALTTCASGHGLTNQVNLGPMSTSASYQTHQRHQAQRFNHDGPSS